MLHPSHATIATFLPFRSNESKRVSILTTVFPSYLQPVDSGGAPVYIVAKQTGVYEGITVRSGRESMVCFNTGSNISGYLLKAT